MNETEPAQLHIDFRTGDIFSNAPGTKKVNTKEIGAAIIEAL